MASNTETNSEEDKTLDSWVEKKFTKELKELYRFAWRFVVYTSVGIICLLPFIWGIESGLDKLTGFSFASNIKLFLTDTRNSLALLTVFMSLFLAFGSSTYVLVRYLPNKDQFEASVLIEMKKALEAANQANSSQIAKSLGTVERSISAVQSSIDQVGICDSLKIISYEKIMEIERACLGREITVITNSLADDSNENHTLPVIIENLKSGKYYQFIVPNTQQNIRDAQALKKALKGVIANNNVEQNESYVTFVSDEMFKICAFRDIAIYGSAAEEAKHLVGYAELPGSLKTANVTPRSFMEIDVEICKSLTADIDKLLTNTDTKNLHKMSLLS